VWFAKIAGSKFQRPGIPDFLLCVRGAFGGLELKAPSGKGKLSELQKLELKKIQQAGGNTYVCNSLETVKAAVDDMRNTITTTKK
jgi:hypothetical protein